MSASLSPSSNISHGWLQRLRIAQKIGLGYAVVLGLTTVGTITGISAGNFQADQAQLYEEDAIEETVELYQLQVTLAELQQNLSQLQLSSQGSQAYRSEYLELIANAEKLTQLWSDFKAEYQEEEEEGFAETEEELEIYSKILENHNKAVTDTLTQLSALPTEATDDDLFPLNSVDPLGSENLYFSVNAISLSAFSNDLNYLIDIIALEELEEAKRNVPLAKSLRNKIIGGSILISILVAALLAAYFSRLVSQPIQRVNQVAQQVTQESNFELEVPIVSGDETGALANSLNHLIQHVEALLHENETRALNLLEANGKLQATQTQMIAQEKLASLGSLTAGIAHEIKNPLNFVNNFSEIAVDLVDNLAEELEAQKAQLNPDFFAETTDVLDSLKTLVSKIEHHGKRADSIVANMLQHSHHGESEWTAVDINALVSEAINLAYHGMRANYSNFNLKFDHDYDEGIGTIQASRQDLSRVFLNITNNACYAMHQRKLREGNDFHPLLKVRTREQDGQVTIHLRDNGIGMTPEVKTKVFEQFFTTKPTGEGTGLGLSLSYNIVVDQHQGNIEIQSDPGVYTDFIVSLPKTAA